MAQKAQYDRIVRSDDIRSGDPRIEGTRLTVVRIKELVEGRGLPAAEVAAKWDLDVADVYQALAYYYDHPEEMTRLEREREEAIRRSFETGARTLADVED